MIYLINKTPSATKRGPGRVHAQGYSRPKQLTQTAKYRGARR